jgi:hypothetical protein
MTDSELLAAPTNRMGPEPAPLTRQEYVDWLAMIGLDANQLQDPVILGGFEIVAIAKHQPNGHDYLLEPEREHIAAYKIRIKIDDGYMLGGQFKEKRHP